MFRCQSAMWHVCQVYGSLKLDYCMAINDLTFLLCLPTLVLSTQFSTTPETILLFSELMLYVA